MFIFTGKRSKSERKGKQKLKSFSNFQFKLIKKGVTSGGSRLSYWFQRKLPIDIRWSNLHVTRPYPAGRSCRGRVVMLTKAARRVKSRIININYKFRYKYISFIANIIILPFSHRLVSLLIMSTGSVSYIPTAHNHVLFHLARMYKFRINLLAIKERLDVWSRKLFIFQSFFLIKHLPRKYQVSLLELVPGQGIKYVRSPSTFAVSTKIDYNLNTSLMQLPSGVRKVFSLYSLGSIGSNPFSDNKKWKSNKAGYYRRYGHKPNVRGVAKNPIDHPHGGRTKSLSYPRTPWGKTTKIK